MAFSGLCTGVILSQYFTKMDNKVVDSVAIHAMSGNMTAKNCGYWFQTEALPDPQNPRLLKPLNASSNYGIGSDGEIYGYVDELNRSYCTSSTGVDKRAITIEVANLTSSEPFEISEAAYRSLINLLVDICVRHNITLRWSNDKEYAVAAAGGGPVIRQNMFVHRWFNSGKSCPGQYLFERQGQIAEEVNKQLRQGAKAVPLYSGEYIYSRSSSNTGAVNANSTNNTSRKLIIIGDSRTVFMRGVVRDPDTVWSCESGMGIDWMKKTGVPEIENHVSRDSAICIWMGINDVLLKSPQEYFTYINACAARWTQKGATVYFVSTGPVGNSRTGVQNYKNIDNTKVMKFNQAVRNGLSSNVGYIDIYSTIINSFVTVDDLHYDNDTSLAIYTNIRSAANRMSPDIITNSAPYGGIDVQTDYTKINPYIVTLDRNSSDNLDYDHLKQYGVVGAMIETGCLYRLDHNKYEEYQQPKFDLQRISIENVNLDYGYFFITRARDVSEAKSEMQELITILRRHTPRLGIWVKLELSNSIATNDDILDYFYRQLVRLGFAGKIGLYTKKSSIDQITWENHQNRWLLWTIDHVQSVEDLKKLLDPEFFDVDGK